MHINLFNLWRICDLTLNFPKLYSFIVITSAFWQICPQLSCYECNLLEIKCIYLEPLSFHVYVAVEKDEAETLIAEDIWWGSYSLCFLCFLFSPTWCTLHTERHVENWHISTLSASMTTPLQQDSFSLFIEFKCLD